MQPLSATRPAAQAPRRDPAPSRAAYKLNRLWLTPIVRRIVRIGLPICAVTAGVAWYLGDEANRAALWDKAAEIRRSVEERPEFMVKLMAVEGASPNVAGAVRGLLPVEFPISSFDLDLEEMQEIVSELDAVKSASLRIRPGGVLEVKITEREPAVLWRTQAGLFLLDETGARVAGVTSRTARPDLPLLAGVGAGDAVEEALDVFAAASPLNDRLRGLVRMGERRWDVVLDHDQRILLPETDPVFALDQVIALDEAQELLSRDVSVIDMRNPARPTLRMTASAVEELRRIRAIEWGGLAK